MKIAHVIDQLGLGGAERVCVNLTNLFNKKGYDVKLIVFNKVGQLFDFLDDDLKVSVLEKDKLGFKAYGKLVDELKDFDIVHVHMRQNYKFVCKALFLFRMHKKVILHDHYGKIITNNKAPLFYKLLFKPKYYIGCSGLLTSWALKKLSLKPDKVFLVNNFVVKNKTEILVEKPKGLVLVGNLKEVKNQKFAIRIAHRLGKDLTIYCAHLNGEYYQELLKLIDDLNYAGRIKFVTGLANIQPELKKYEMGLLTSISEGDPLVIIEYLAQGIPFLCSDFGESVKVIKKYFPYFVQEDFSLENWTTNYKKAVITPSAEIEGLYDKYFAEGLYFEKYLDIYNEIMA